MILLATEDSESVSIAGYEAEPGEVLKREGC